MPNFLREQRFALWSLDCCPESANWCLWQRHSHSYAQGRRELLLAAHSQSGETQTEVLLHSAPSLIGSGKSCLSCLAVRSSSHASAGNEHLQTHSGLVQHFYCKYFKICLLM